MFGRITRAHRHLKFYNVQCNNTIERYKLPATAERNQGTEKQKIINNLVWCNAAVAVSLQTKRYKTLYIDGPEARTTRILQDAGYIMADCIPVNDAQHTVDVLKSYSTDVKRLTFAECVKAGKFDGLSAVWYDGCGTLLGTSDNKPLHDIKNLLEVNNLDGAILAVTFCMRDNRGVSGEEARAYLEKMIKTCGYRMTEPAIINYPPAMCFWMTQLTLDDQPLL